jgi:hypothetical protein
MNTIWKEPGKYLRSWPNRNNNPPERESERKNFTPEVPGEEYLE